ncbi:hypothetical protein TYRP_017264 [Tyrophagus putrescentiae]|nr:hypothetical protein TYRP_017264 [Tyrophagus putrescentiae]
MLIWLILFLLFFLFLLLVQAILVDVLLLVFQRLIFIRLTFVFFFLLLSLFLVIIHKLLFLVFFNLLLIQLFLLVLRIVNGKAISSCLLSDFLEIRVALSGRGGGNPLNHVSTASRLRNKLKREDTKDLPIGKLRRPVDAKEELVLVASVGLPVRVSPRHVGVEEDHLADVVDDAVDAVVHLVVRLVRLLRWVLLLVEREAGAEAAGVGRQVAVAGPALNLLDAVLGMLHEVVEGGQVLEVALRLKGGLVVDENARFVLIHLKLLHVARSKDTSAVYYHPFWFCYCSDLPGQDGHCSGPGPVLADDYHSEVSVQDVPENSESRYWSWLAVGGTRSNDQSGPTDPSDQNDPNDQNDQNDPSDPSDPSGRNQNPSPIYQRCRSSASSKA